MDGSVSSDMNINKLKVFSRGFLQDALTLMGMMEKEGITQEDIKLYIKVPKKRKKSGIRRQFGNPVGNPKPFSKKKNIGCKPCKEKKIELHQVVDEQNLKEE